MATITWINPAGGDWSQGLNWDGGQVPTAADDALLTLSTTMTITISTVQQTHAVSFQGADTTFVITPSGRLEATASILLDGEAIQINGGTLMAGGDITLRMDGTISLSGTAYIIAGGAVTLDGNDIVEFGNAGTVAATGTVTQVSNGGTLSLSVACFAEGTRIATPNGSRRVEQLTTEDHVRLADGGSARVTWIGHRHIDCDRHPMPASVMPVRIRRDAFAPGRPSRDLFLSPDHAVHHEGVLIPIHCLINGGAISVAPRARVTYYHVELARHDILLAEGLPVESYLEAGGRSSFQNGGPVIQLHPDLFGLTADGFGCAPRVVTGPIVDATRRHLAARDASSWIDPAEAAQAASAG